MSHLKGETPTPKSWTHPQIKVFEQNIDFDWIELPYLNGWFGDAFGVIVLPEDNPKNDPLTYVRFQFVEFDHGLWRVMYYAGRYQGHLAFEFQRALQVASEWILMECGVHQGRFFYPKRSADGSDS